MEVGVACNGGGSGRSLYQATSSSLAMMGARCRVEGGGRRTSSCRQRGEVIVVREGLERADHKGCEFAASSDGEVTARRACFSV